MGTIIDPTAIRTQSDGIIRALTAQNSTLKNVLPSISNFQNESELSGAAWSGLKSHIGGHRSVIQGLICANEDVINDSEELITASGSEKLDEDKIKAEIANLEAENRMYSGRIMNLSNLIKSVGHSLDYMVSNVRLMDSYYERIRDSYKLIGGNNKCINDLKKKLTKIYKIISATSSLYTTSEVLYSNVETGMLQLGASGSGGGFTGVAGGMWQNKIDKRWAIREEVNAERFLLKERFDDKQIAHMKNIGYTAVELKLEWETLESEEDRKFYKLMATGTEKAYLKAFGIDPNDLTEAMTMAIGNYVWKLGQGNRLDMLESFNQAILESTTMYRYSDNPLSETSLLYRDVYLDRLIATLSIKNDLESASLEAALAKGTVLTTDTKFMEWYNQYQKGLSLTNLFLTERLALTNLAKSENGDFALMCPKLSDILYSNGSYSFNFSYQGGTFNKDGQTGELVTKNFDSRLLNHPNDLDNHFSREAIASVMSEKENLVAKYLLNSGKAVTLLVIGLYGGPYLAIGAGLVAQALDKEAESLDGLEDALGVSLNSGKLGLGASNEVVANIFNFWLENKKLDNQLSNKLYQTKLEWFGTGGRYDMSGVDTDGNVISDSNLGGLTFSGIQDPIICYKMEQWQSEGLDGWYEGDELQKLINTRLEGAVDSGSKFNIDKVKKQIEKITPLLDGSFKLESDSDIQDFLNMVAEFDKMTDGNLQDTWRDSIKQK